ncbi:MAG: hypothetical protein FWC91_09945 [Defluviitaleaceae bacterium]|nr:hypothetical protein [Defluviitaleaceae bacterium]
MIQQHCYTKTKQGIFNKHEGYDTVARSPGLTESFIKERIHPFCFYHPSRLLQAKRVPAEEFPRTLNIVHFPEGQMLIGQTIYVESDYTNQHSTFFTHNYILPKPENLSPENIGTMLCRTNFLTETEWDQLLELKELPLHDSIATGTVGPLPFDQHRMQQLIYVLLDAILGIKKVYVILPDLVWVRPTLMWIYDQLPKDAAQTLGFTTYSREPEKKQFLHLIFMEKGSILPGDARVKDDYILDFYSGYFSENLPD